MTRKKSTLLWTLALLLFAISSCEYTNIEPIEVVLPDEKVSFSEEIAPVLASKCASCHQSVAPILSAGNEYNNLINGGYINLDTPAESILYTKTSGGHPAGSGLTATELAIILKWIEEGAENN